MIFIRTNESKKMKLLTKLISVVIVIAAIGCTTTDKKVKTTSGLENGIYLVLNDYKGEIPDTENAVIEYSHDFLDENEQGQPVYIEIDTSDFVKLDLADEPDGIEQEDKRINLMLTLNNFAAEQLADFTEKNLNKRVAIVIGGKAVTMHKVRTRIEGGKLQITRCTDNACKYLLIELQNVNIAPKIAKIDSLKKLGYRMLDYHAHLKGGLTIDELLEHSEKTGISYGVAANCGLGFPIQNDSALMAYYNEMSAYPVLVAMQAEGREWLKNFNTDSVALFDYVFTDALTFFDAEGRRTRLWLKDEVFIDDENEFMEYYVNQIVDIINNEPFDIFVNPTFLPEKIRDNYNSLWTKERMQKVIDALKANNKALEINARYRIPSADFIKLAKANGIKFAMGTNNVEAELGYLEYCVEMIKECKLQPDDFLVLENKNSL